MNDVTFQRFRELIHREGGIALGEQKNALLTGRIQQRLSTLGLHSAEQYFRAVQDSPNEVVQLLDAISTNHTFFFRESEHFDVLRNHLREKARQGQRRFRIWCAAASSGEEPYSLAMSVLDLFDEMAVAADLKILATDISTKVLTQADVGWYSKERCACLPSVLKTKYFESEYQDRMPGFRVRSRLRDVVMYRRLNLIEFPYPLNGPIDAIFLRNVMIYFDETTRRAIISYMQRLLQPQGLLFVGMTESILGMHEGYEYVSPSVYRRQ